MVDHNQNQQLISYLPFHTKEFWDKFYKENDQTNINWYFDITKIKEFNIKENISTEDELLIVGPGLTSALDFFKNNGYDKIEMYDFSEQLVKIIKNRYNLNEDSSWDIECKDITEINDEDIFDKIIDKGCLDCLLSDPYFGESSFVKALNNLIRSLVKNGVLFYFSDGKIEDRINLFYKISGIKYKVTTIDMNNDMKEEYKEFNPSDNIYYLYTISKV